MQKLSYSALQTFSTCPLQYKFAYKDKLRTEQTAQMSFGTLLHQVMEELYSPTLLPISKDELLHIVTTKWQKNLYKDKTVEKQDMVEATTIIEREWNKRYLQLDTHTVALEQSFLFPIDSKFAIRGRIDRIDKLASDTLEIIDYKTGYHVPSDSELRQNLQLATYFLAVKNLWPEIPTIKLTLNYLRLESVVSFMPETAFVDDAQGRLGKLVSELRISDFSPRAGKHCDHCSFRKICPLMKSKYTTEIL